MIQYILEVPAITEWK